jgi:hypothetical protein
MERVHAVTQVLCSMLFALIHLNSPLRALTVYSRQFLFEWRLASFCPSPTSQGTHGRALGQFGRYSTLVRWLADIPSNDSRVASQFPGSSPVIDRSDHFTSLSVLVWSRQIRSKGQVLWTSPLKRSVFSKFIEGCDDEPDTVEPLRSEILPNCALSAIARDHWWIRAHRGRSSGAR